MEERFVVVTEEAAYSFIQNALPKHFVGSTSFSVNIFDGKLFAKASSRALHE